MPTPENLRFVEAELNYLTPMAERPRYYAYSEAPPTNMAYFSTSRKPGVVFRVPASVFE